MKTIVILSHVGFDNNSPYCNYVHWHAKEFVKQGYKVVVLAVIHWLPIFSHFQKQKKEFIKKIKAKNKVQIIDGVEVIYQKAFSLSNFLYDSPINVNGFLYYKSIKNIFKKIFKKENVVLIDAHTFKVEGYAAYKLKKKYPNIYTTVTLHGTSFERNTKNINGVKQIQKVFGVVDKAICVSNKIKKKLEQLNILNAIVIYNGINKYRTEENPKKEKQSIISVGGLTKVKNFDITINAIKQLSSKYPKVHLTIIGEGSQKKELTDLVEKLNIKEKVTFLGRRANEEVIKHMNKKQIFLLPSCPEGFGIVYAEAMKEKCITIGTKGEGIDGFITNGINGFLVNPNVEEIVNLITDIFEKKYNTKEIIKKAQMDASNLTWEKNVKEYIKLIEERK